MSKVPSFAENADKIVEIPLAFIQVNSDWNSRSGKWEIDDGDEESQQFEGLVESIKQEGQLEPVVVRIVDNPLLPYELVTGFRRCKAIAKIASDLEKKEPTVRCIVRRMDDVLARTENIRENTARASITVPDLAWGIYDLSKTAKQAGTPMSGVQIAAKIGMNQSYVAALLKIAEKTKANVFKRWRDSAVHVSYRVMVDIANLPKDEQEAAFASIAQIDTGEGGGEPAGKEWVVAAKKKGCLLATMLGNLEREQLISTTPLDFDSHLDYFVPCLKLKKGATANNRRSIAAAMRKAYEEALNYVEPEEDELPVDETDDEKPRRRKAD